MYRIRNYAGLVALAVAMVFTGSHAWAQLPIDTVAVGDVGNAPEATGEAASGWGPSADIGTVDHPYRIGKFEVTNGLYIEFLNAVARTDAYGLYQTEMGGTYGGIQRAGTSGIYTYTPKSGDSNWLNRPVNFVSFWDAARFVNWLHNGRPSGPQTAVTTERGAYTVDGATGYDDRTITRNPGAKWAIPTQDEWYKTAYYKGGSVNAGYWTYAIAGDTRPVSAAPPSAGQKAANYCGDAYAGGSPYYTTPVGAYGASPGPYGTFDQNGNVWEWNETVTYVAGATWSHPAHSRRGVRGGSWANGSLGLMAAEAYCGEIPNSERYNLGFRVVQLSDAPPPVVQVQAAHIFYNRSVFDGFDPAANEDDDDAIDPDKEPLLPGQAPTAANHTGYFRGIDGVMVDISGLVATPTAADFVFEVADAYDAATWDAAADAISVTLRPGAGTNASDRITIIWDPFVNADCWLKVTVLSDANGGTLGLAEDYVFCFANQVGDASGDGKVDLSDLGILATNFGTTGGIEMACKADFSGDGGVDLTDLGILSTNWGAGTQGN